jgi:hypothetical protein
VAPLDGRGFLSVPDELRVDDGAERRALWSRRVRLYAFDRQPAGRHDRRSDGLRWAGCIAAGPNAGPDAVPGEPSPPPASAIPAAPGEEKTVVFSRGTCFFSTRIAAGQDLGYDAVIIEQGHGGTRNGLLVDGFFCGGQGHDYDERIPAICLGHRGTHLMFNDAPQYTDPAGEGRDIPLGTPGEKYVATTEFDGWGYVQLHDASQPDLPIVDSYAVPEALDERFAEGFGDFSVHEMKTDPRRGVNLAYFSCYAAGFRVADFGRQGIREVGFYIDEGGNNFWASSRSATRRPDTATEPSGPRRRPAADRAPQRPRLRPVHLRVHGQTTAQQTRPQLSGGLRPVEHPAPKKRGRCRYPTPERAQDRQLDSNRRPLAWGRPGARRRGANARRRVTARQKQARQHKHRGRLADAREHGLPTGSGETPDLDAAEVRRRAARPAGSWPGDRDGRDIASCG